MESGLQIKIHGTVDNQIGISLISPPSRTIEVSDFYLKLEAWAECSLRNEFTMLQAFSRPVVKMFKISEEYDRYDIVFFDSLVAPSRQVFVGRDINAFDIWVEYEPYKLYFLSVYAEYYDSQDISKKLVINSKPIPLIKVENGNTGGCLVLENWWKPSLNKNPRRASQSSGMPQKMYSMLTEHFDMPLNKSIYDERFYNEFKDFYEKHQSLFQENNYFERNAVRMFEAYGHK